MTLGISNGAFFGLILCVPLTLRWLVLIRLEQVMMLHGNSSVIQPKIGPKTAKATRHRTWITAIAFVVLLIIGAASLLRLNSWVGGLPYGPVFASLFTMGLVVNLFDLCILDWMIGKKLRLAFGVSSDIKPTAGYETDTFHLREFLFALLISLALSLIISGFIELITLLTKR